MTPFAWGLLLGLLVAAKDGDAPLDPVSRRQAEMEQRVWHNLNRTDHEEHA